MGLDMYLSKKVYVKNWPHTPANNRHKITVKRGGGEVPKTEINPERIETITESLGYWRKANAIHNWFIENCAGGTDDCRPVYISREHLQELLDTVNKVLESSELVAGQVVARELMKDGKWVPEYEDGKVIKDTTFAQELLPTASGFFFGDGEYDEWYHEHLIETKQILEDALSDETADDFEYQASW